MTMETSQLFDLGPGGAGLGALIAQTDAVTPTAVAVRALALEVLGAVAVLDTAGAPVRPGHSSWLVQRGGEGALASGPGGDVVVEGPLQQPVAIHVTTDRRTLSILPPATEPVTAVPQVAGRIERAVAGLGISRFRARLVEGHEVVVDTTVGGAPGIAGADGGDAPIDHLDGAIAGAVAARLAGEVLRRLRPVEEQAADDEWAATSIVGAVGIDGRAEADPVGAVTIHLPAGTPVRVLRRWGDWAQVDTADGWSGWVDARLLR